MMILCSGSARKFCCCAVMVTTWLAGSATQLSAQPSVQPTAQDRPASQSADAPAPQTTPSSPTAGSPDERGAVRPNPDRRPAEPPAQQQAGQRVQAGQQTQAGPGTTPQAVAGQTGAAPTAPRVPAPRASRPSRRQPRNTTPRFTSFSFRRRRLARTPDMLGDSFLPPLELLVLPQNPTNDITGRLQLAVVGGGARAKLAEHNKALPVDRIYASYNHFHNAAQRDVVAAGPGPAVGGTRSVDRFTIGLERSFNEGRSSLELRLPLTGYPDLGGEFPGLGVRGVVSSDVGTLGNLSIVGKRLLLSEEDLTVSAGLGVELPLGEDAWSRTGYSVFHVENQAVYLQPFLAATLDNGATFLHSFLQLDVEANGNPLRVQSLFAAGGPSLGPPTGSPAFEHFGDLEQPTLIHWDTSVGHWLTRSNEERGITGIAAMAEFHLTASLSDPQGVSGATFSDSGPVEFLAQAGGGQFPATYFTTGLHMEISRDTTVRVAGVFPLAAQQRRLFDAEVLVQIGRRY